MSRAHEANPALRERAALWRLARRCGVQPAYIDNDSVKRRASPDALLAVLNALGVPIARADHAGEVMRRVEVERAQRVIEPIIVRWQSGPAVIGLRLPAHDAARPIELHLALEDGKTRTWTHHALTSESIRTHEIGGRQYARLSAPLPDDLPLGYHRLTVRLGGGEHEARLIAAPDRAVPIINAHEAAIAESHQPTADSRQPTATGLFIPLYALRSDRDRGVGDLTDLRHLLEWMSDHGASVLGTLPLLATYLGHGRSPCNPSPYSPVSRLFFNEIYLDVYALLRESAASNGSEAGGQGSVERRDEVAALPALDHVDYAQVMKHKRAIIEPLAHAAFENAGARRPIEREAAADPLLGQYARFRAVVERHGPHWRDWPSDRHRRIRDDALTADDADPAALRYHLYVQWHLKRQLSALCERNGPLTADGRQPTASLYLDLPVGVHPHGFDAWRFRESFVESVAAGAPPDDFFTGGQNWGFAPLHPWRAREHGHECFIESIRRHLQFAGALRIDHVMWLHRMYWLPDGFPATEGVYVRNPAPEELYAILCLESHRNGAAIVGENLGTVPDRVNRTMARRGIHPLFVGQFSFASGEFTAESAEDAEKEIGTDDNDANAGNDTRIQNHASRPTSSTDRSALSASSAVNLFHPVPHGAVASLNTHDTPTFAAFWRGLDIDQRLEWGLLDAEEAERERAGRAGLRARIIGALRGRGIHAEENDPPGIAVGLLEMLAGTDAAVVLATLEDLWGEQRPQNVPGTSGETNWSRKAARSLEEIVNDERIRGIVRRLVGSGGGVRGDSARQIRQGVRSRPASA